MPITDDIRKTLTDPTPLYFAAGVIDKIRAEAPERLAAVRATDPREVQAKVTAQAKETQAKVSEALGGIDTDVKKLREQAQTLALQSVGMAVEYAVKARESYDELAERGRGAVENWRGEDDREVPEVTVERAPVRVAEPPAAGRNGVRRDTVGGTAGAKPKPKPEMKTETDTEPKAGAKTEPKAGAKAEPKSAPKAAPKSGPQAKAEPGAKPAAKKSTARRTAPAPRKSAPGSEG